MSELVDQISKLEAKAHALKESVNNNTFFLLVTKSAKPYYVWLSIKTRLVTIATKSFSYSDHYYLYRENI